MHSIGNQLATTAVPSNDTRNTRESSHSGSGTITLHQKTGPSPEVSTAEIAYASVALFEGEGRASTALYAQGMAPQGRIREENTPTRKRGGFANKELILSARQQQLNEQLSSQATRSGSNTSRVRASAMGAADLKSKALAQLQHDVMQVNLSRTPKDVIGSFLRNDSLGQRMIKNAIISEFKAPAQKLMADVFAKLQVSLTSLGPNAPMNQIDNALTEAFKTMIDGFNDIDFPESLEEASKVISSSLDKAVDTQATMATSDMQRQIRALAPDLKDGIKKTLLLRVFMPHVLEIARGATLQGVATESKATVDRLNGWLQSHPQAKVSGFTMSKFANILLTSINGANGDKYADLESHFPALLQAIKQTRPDV